MTSDHTTYDDGCPCGNNCCSDPMTHASDHTCTTDDFCEDCFYTECDNCGSSCCCDL